jgi:hypothetical protein
MFVKIMIDWYGIIQISMNSDVMKDRLRYEYRISIKNGWQILCKKNLKIFLKTIALCLFVVRKI